MSEQYENEDTETQQPAEPTASPPAPAPPAATTPPAPYPAAPNYATAVINDDPRRKSPILASILSFMPGLGQVYVGYYQRGFVHLLTVASTIGVMNSDSLRNNEAIIPVFAFFLAFFWMYNVIDAGRRATFYNYALAGGSDIDLPQGFGSPVTGSMPGGVAAIAVGVILLANTLFDISLRWLNDWWPMAIILFGVYLVMKARQDSSKEPSDGDLAGYE